MVPALDQHQPGQRIHLRQKVQPDIRAVRGQKFKQIPEPSEAKGLDHWWPNYLRYLAQWPIYGLYNLWLIYVAGDIKYLRNAETPGEHST